MNQSLRTLIVEDNEDDSLLLLRELRKAGYETVHERVETAEAMKRALREEEWDLVISDYMLPSFSGLAALEVLQRSGHDLPFIIVSGNIGEDIAVQAMKAGAHDYIIKGNLARLVPAIERELREAEHRRKRNRIEDQLRESRQKLFETLENMNEGFFTLDREWRFSYVNAEAAKLWKKDRADLLGTILWETVPGAAGTIFDQEYRRAVRERVPVHFDALSPLLGIWVEVRAYPTDDGLAVYFHDITARKESEEQIARLNRLYQVLSQVGEAIIRINSAGKLYEEICRITVTEGLFKMAWIGIAEPGSKQVVPVASYGDSGGYLKEITVVASDVPEGRGPTGRAVFEGKYRISGDIGQDPVMRPWRDKALGHGFRASAAFPLRSGREVIGAFTVYGDQPRSFTNEEIALLSSLADDVSYAIDSLANEERRKKAEEQTRVTNALLKLFAQKYSRKEYLDAACELIRRWSGARHVGIRLADIDGKVPFESCRGYTDEFLEAERTLSLLTDQCICTRVIAGAPEPAERGSMTPSGSFISADTEKFMKDLSAEERTRYRGVCMRLGFRALAVIPIRYRENPIGAIHLADEQAGLLGQETILFLEQLAYIIGEAIFRFGIEDDLRQNHERLAATNEELRNLQAHIEAVREGERAHIAREVHDQLGQTMTALKMDIAWLNKKHPSQDPDVRERSAEMLELVDGAIQSVKRITAELRPSVLDDFGLQAAIEWTAQEFEKRSGVKCRVLSRPVSITMDRTRSTVIYRVLQEALTNVARHAQAKTVIVSLDLESERFRMTVRDDGKGIAAERVNDPAAYGLMGMRERVRFLGGDIDISGAPGRGTTITVSIPLLGVEGPAAGVAGEGPAAAGNAGNGKESQG